MAIHHRWKLAFKKQVAATPRYSEQAFAWITEVEKANCFQELQDSGAFPQLAAKLAAELDKTKFANFASKFRLKKPSFPGTAEWYKVARWHG